MQVLGRNNFKKMNNQQLIYQAKQLAKIEFSRYTGKFGSAFMIAMTEECIFLANRYAEKDMNKSALLIGIYLHDIGRIVTDEDDHTLESAKIAERFLKENEIEDSELKEIVLDCCLNHGSKATPKTKEGKLMQFIDKAALINKRMIQLYIKTLSQTLSEQIAIAKAKEKLEQWHNKLGERKEELKKEYMECKKYLEIL